MSTERRPLEYWLPRLFLIGLLALLTLAGWQWRHGEPLSANLMELVPGSTPDALEQIAEQRMQEPLNREILLLVGHADKQRAIELARQVGAHWQASGLFETVQWNLQTNLPAVREQLLQGRLAMLAALDRKQLIEQPQAFIQARVQTLFDPFAGFSLVASQDDWLGLTERIQNSQPKHGAVQLDVGSGALIAEARGKFWVLLRARSHGDAFDSHLPTQVADLLAAARDTVGASQGQVLAASGLLFAASGRAQASREMLMVGGGSIIGIVALLLVVFRRVQVLLAFVPVAVGVLSGMVACVAVFGSVHVMTLVLGASLIGVAVDYPLHYLSKSWSLQPWRSWPALKLTRSGLSLSLATSCIGYLALAWTPFPALTQIAIFSAAGLLGAYLCAACLLPALWRNLDLRPAHWPLRLAEQLLATRAALLARIGTPWLLAGLLMLCAGGLWQLHSKNDLRQWIGSPPELVAQAQAVAQITGFQPTSQFFLVRAADPQQLLERQAALATRLDNLISRRQLQGYLALSQLVATPAEQQQTRKALAQLPAYWQPLLDLGLPVSALQDELKTLLSLPDASIEQTLAGPLGEPWRPLWLGRQGAGVAGMVSLQGLSDAQLLASQAEGLPGVQLVDRLGDLNRVFAATQVSAAELKLLSCVIIVLLMSLPFGWRGALRIIALPLLAALCSLACLGWLGQPLTLFSLFGLLLVTAISVDYAILIRDSVGGPAVSLLGTLLAALTTWLSFGLLAVSSTPAISNFGLSVSLGLGFSFLLAPWARQPALPLESITPARSNRVER